MNSGYGRKSLIVGMMLNLAPSLKGYRYICGAIAESSKGHSITLSSQLFQMSMRHGKPSELHECGTIVILHLL
jgi:hypothetical protein